MLRKAQCIGILKENIQITLPGKFDLEEVVDMSQERPRAN